MRTFKATRCAKVWTSKTFEVPDDMHEDDVADYAYDAPGDWCAEGSSFIDFELEEL